MPCSFLVNYKETTRKLQRSFVMYVAVRWFLSLALDMISLIMFARSRHVLSQNPDTTTRTALRRLPLKCQVKHNGESNGPGPPHPAHVWLASPSPLNYRGLGGGEEMHEGQEGQPDNGHE